MMDPNYTRGTRERVLGAPAVELDSGSGATLTFTTQQMGTYNISRACFAVGQDVNAISNYEGPRDFAALSVASRFALNGGTEFIRGRTSGTRQLPLSAWSPLRQSNFVAYQDQGLEVGNTLALLAEYTVTGGTARLIGAVPYTPSNAESQGDIFEEALANGLYQSEIALAAVPATPADAASGKVDITSDIDCIVDMRRLWLAGHIQVGAGLNYVDCSAALEVGSITVEGGTNLIQGQGTSPVAANIWTPHRQRHWVDLGLWRLTPGSVISIVVNNELGAALVDLTAGVPCVPLGSAKSCPPKVPSYPC